MAPPVVQPAPAPPPEAATELVEEAAPELSERDRLRQWRIDHLEDPHFTLDVFARTHGVGNRQTDPVALAGSLSLGYARNVSRRFGFMARGVASLGAVALLPGQYSDYEGGTPSAAYYAIEGELIPYLGPLGIFYVGPILSIGYHGYSRDELVAGGRGESAQLRDGTLYGLGIAMGFFAGKTRRVHISGFAKTTFTNWMTHQLGAGIGYRFGPEGSGFR